mmetsp:Transcript_86977/g.106668  ORF Transcript_86977/g.106668 Transcript_86977/m.106668 type:complete len:109 (-) Transcript_86977:114-440(-)
MPSESAPLVGSMEYFNGSGAHKTGSPNDINTYSLQNWSTMQILFLGILIGVVGLLLIQYIIYKMVKGYKRRKRGNEHKYSTIDVTSTDCNSSGVDAIECDNELFNHKK